MPEKSRFIGESGTFDDTFLVSSSSLLPGGIVYSPRAGKFLIVPASPGKKKHHSAVVPVTTSQELESANTVGLPADIQPINTAFDAKFNRFLGLNRRGTKLFAVKAGTNGDLDPSTLSEINVKAFKIRNAKGMTLDPATGTLYVVDGRTKELVVIQPDASGSYGRAIPSRIALPSNLESPKGIAFDPIRKHIHVFSPRQQTLFELTQQGQSVATRDLSEFGIRNSEGLTFASSSDTTDNPGQLNLYIADSAAGSAGIHEASFVKPPLPPTETPATPLPQTSATGAADLLTSAGSTTGSTNPTVSTDKQDYAPGQTATFTASGFPVGGAVEFQVLHQGPGPDGISGTADDKAFNATGSGHDPFYRIDGGSGDLDGQPNGTVVTAWFVNPDDSAGETFLLTAKGVEAGGDGIFGTADDADTGATATTTFTDSPTVLPLVRTIQTSQFNPASPDPAGITYDSSTGRLVVSDSEVEEIKSLFTGKNVWEVTLSGSVVRTDGITQFTKEPTGVSFDPVSGDFFFSDDDRDRVYRARRGVNGYTLLSSFNTRNFGSNDAEDVTVASDRGSLFISDGDNREIYEVTPSGTLISQFDTNASGLIDPEGIVYDSVTGHLFIVGEPTNLVWELTPQGAVVNTYDISAANAVLPAGLTIAPNSQDPTKRSIYIVDRAIDNNDVPTENDGKIYEFSLGPVPPPPSADLSLSQTASNSTPTVGENVTFSVTVNNAGPNPTSNVAVSDQLPAGLSFVSATPSQGSYDAATGAWTVGSLANGGNATLDVVATVTSTTGITNTAQVSASSLPDPDSTPGNSNPAEDDQASVSLTPQAPASADLSLSQTVSNPTPTVGSNVTFSLNLNNAGPNPTDNVAVSDQLLAGLSFVSATPSQGSYDAATGVWTVGSLASGGNATLDVVATVTSTTGITNTAQVSASSLPDPDSTPGNNNPAEDDQASVSLTPQTSTSADLSLSQTVSNPTPTVGSNVTFSLNLNNAGPNPTDNVAVSDQLPAGLSFVSATPSQDSYDAATGAWNVGSLASGGNATLNLVATVNNLPTGGLTNTAQVSASSLPDPDSTPGNSNPVEDDQASVTLTSPTILVKEFRIAAGSDDAEENLGTGSTSTTSGDLELVNNGGVIQAVGMRWNGLDIPQGAVITNAYVQFQVDAVSTGAANLTIRGQAADNAATFNTISRNISSRPVTTASAAWNPADWPTIGATGVNQRTSNVASVVQEIVNRPGWSSGNSLALVINGTGIREAESFEGKPAGAPLLHVEYYIPSPPSSATAAPSSLLAASNTSSPTAFAADATNPTVTTDKTDYAPGETATITASGFPTGSSVKFQVLHEGPGPDVIKGTADDKSFNTTGSGHTPFYGTDGGTGDLDGQTNGTVVTQWYVNPEDSLGETFSLTAKGVIAGSDGVLGTADDTATGPAATTTFTDGPTALPLVRTIQTSQFNPASPDPAGITYDSSKGRLVITDSEVEEIPSLFTGKNLWEITRSGGVVRTNNTTNFTKEPTGISFDSTNGNFYISDDDRKTIYRAKRSANGYTLVSSFGTQGFGSGDPEDVSVANNRNSLFIADGVNREIYEVSKSGSLISQFDTNVIGLNDPEALHYDSVTGHLFVIGEPVGRVFELTPQGTIVNTYDISAANPVQPAGITIAPNSQNSNQRSLYIVDRGIDNNDVPTENDGKVYEFSLGSLATTSATSAIAPAAADSVTDTSLVATDSATAETGADGTAVTTLVAQPEDGVAAGTNAGESVVPLQVSIQEITPTSPSNNSDAGDGSSKPTATVTFYRVDKLTTTGDFASSVIAAGVPLNLIDSDPAAVSAIADLNVSLGSEEDARTVAIGYLVEGDYQGSGETILTLSRPDSVSTTGSGKYTVLDSQAGTYAGEVGTLAKFGFNYRPLQNGELPQGRATIIYKTDDGKKYAIQTNAPESLDATGALEGLDGAATVVGKAHVTDITDPTQPIGIGGDLELILDVAGSSESSSTHTIGITLRHGRDLLYSNNWNGEQTIGQAIESGAIAVKPLDGLPTDVAIADEGALATAGTAATATQSTASNAIDGGSNSASTAQLDALAIGLAATTLATNDIDTVAATEDGRDEGSEDTVVSTTEAGTIDESGDPVFPFDVASLLPDGNDSYTRESPSAPALDVAEAEAPVTVTNSQPEVESIPTGSDRQFVPETRFLPDWVANLINRFKGRTNGSPVIENGTIAEADGTVAPLHDGAGGEGAVPQSSAPPAQPPVTEPVNTPSGSNANSQPHSSGERETTVDAYSDGDRRHSEPTTEPDSSSMDGSPVNPDSDPNWQADASHTQPQPEVSIAAEGVAEDNSNPQSDISIEAENLGDVSSDSSNSGESTPVAEGEGSSVDEMPLIPDSDPNSGSAQPELDTPVASEYGSKGSTDLLSDGIVEDGNLAAASSDSNDSRDGTSVVATLEASPEGDPLNAGNGTDDPLPDATVAAADGTLSDVPALASDSPPSVEAVTEDAPDTQPELLAVAETDTDTSDNSSPEPETAVASGNEVEEISQQPLVQTETIADAPSNTASEATETVAEVGGELLDTSSISDESGNDWNEDANFPATEGDIAADTSAAKTEPPLSGGDTAGNALDNSDDIQSDETIGDESAIAGNGTSPDLTAENPVADSPPSESDPSAPVETAVENSSNPQAEVGNEAEATADPPVDTTNDKGNDPLNGDSDTGTYDELIGGDRGDVVAGRFEDELANTGSSSTEPAGDGNDDTAASGAATESSDSGTAPIAAVDSSDDALGSSDSGGFTHQDDDPTSLPGATSPLPTSPELASV